MSLMSEGQFMDVTYHERDSQIKYHRDGCRHHNGGMNTLGERLKTCREAMKLKQGELAARAGLRNQSIIGMLEIGERKQSSHLPAIASALGVNVLWLQYGRGPMRGAEGHALNALERTVGHLANVEPGSPIRGEVPLISWVQAGAWSDIVDNFAPGDAEDWLPCPRKFGPHAFALRVRGLSMEPRYQSGDIIFVDPDAGAEHGKHVVVRLDDEHEATFKQLVIEGGQRFLLALEFRLFFHPRRFDEPGETPLLRSGDRRLDAAPGVRAPELPTAERARGVPVEMQDVPAVAAARLVTRDMEAV